MNYRWWKVKLLGPNWEKGYVFTFRGMNRGECDNYTKIKSANKSASLHGKEINDSANLYAVNHCVQGNFNWEDLPYGTLCTLAHLIFKKSLICADVYHEAITRLSTDEGLMEAKAVTVMAGITFEYLRTCDPVDYASAVLFAETMWGQNSEPQREEQPGRQTESTFSWRKQK